jgi:hypothetical protein
MAGTDKAAKRPSGRAAKRASGKADPRIDQAASEVALHKLDSAADRAAKRISARITLDTQGNYSVSDQASR